MKVLRKQGVWTYGRDENVKVIGERKRGGEKGKGEKDMKRHL